MYIGHHNDPEHLMHGIDESTQVPFDELGYDIPTSLPDDNYFVGERSLYDRLDILKQELDRLRSQIDNRLAGFGMTWEQYVSADTVPSNVYHAVNPLVDSWLFLYDEYDLMVEKLNCYIDPLNIPQKVSDVETKVTAMEAVMNTIQQSISDLRDMINGITGGSQPDPVPGLTPSITISGGTAITEGQNAIFTITSNPVPSSLLPVVVQVTESGRFVSTGTGTKTVTIGVGGTVLFSIPTTNDATDEPDGSVTVTLNPGTGYTVSSPSTASVTINDDDAPLPTTPPATQQTAIQGIVFFDSNNNGLLDSSETPINEMNVDILGPVNLTTTTDPNGMYRFENLNAGSYTVFATQGTNVVFKIVDLQSGQTATENLAFHAIPQPTQFSRLQGMVFTDLNENNRYDPFERSLSNASVTLTKPDSSTQTTTTDKFGTFVFTNLGTGAHSVIASHGSIENYGITYLEPDKSTTLNIALEPPTPILTVPSTKQSILIGTVFTDSNNDGIYDVSETPIPFNFVHLFKSDGGNFDSVTSKNGVYKFTNLDAGNYTLLISTIDNIFSASIDLRPNEVKIVNAGL